MLHKSLPERDRRKTLLRRRLLDTLAWGMFVVTLKWSNASAIIGAHRDYRRMARELYADIKAPEVNLLRQGNGPDVSLLAQYYLRRRRTFRAIESASRSY